MADPSELVKRVRAKYPEEYRDLSDAELESRVLAKFPEYRDLATPKTPTQTEQTQNSNVGLGTVAGAAAYTTGQAIQKGIPAAHRTASYIARTPLAQKVLASGAVAAVSPMTGLTGNAAEALLTLTFGDKLSNIVGEGAKKLSDVTKTMATGRNAKGQFVKLSPAMKLAPFLKSLSGLSFLDAERAVMERINDPAEIDALPLTDAAKAHWKAKLQARTE